MSEKIAGMTGLQLRKDDNGDIYWYDSEKRRKIKEETALSYLGIEDSEQRPDPVAAIWKKEDGADMPVLITDYAGYNHETKQELLRAEDGSIIFRDELVFPSSGKEGDPSPYMPSEIKQLVESEVQRLVASELQSINNKLGAMEEENRKVLEYNERLKQDNAQLKQELEVKNRQIEDLLASASSQAGLSGWERDRIDALAANDLEARLRTAFPQNYLSRLSDFAVTGYQLEVARAAHEGRAPQSYKEYSENLAKMEMDHLKETSERKKDGVYERIDQPQATQAELARYLALSYQNPLDGAVQTPQPDPTTVPGETPSPAQAPKSYTIVETRTSDILSGFRRPKRVIVDNVTGEEEVVDESVEVKRGNKVLAVAGAIGAILLLYIAVEVEENEHAINRLKAAQPAYSQPVIVRPNVKVVVPKQKTTVVAPPATEQEPETTTTPESPPTTTTTTTTPETTPAPAPSESSSEDGTENEGGFQIQFYNNASGNRGFGVVLPPQIELRRSNSRKPYYSLFDTRLGRVIVQRVTWDRQGNLSQNTQNNISSWNGDYEVEQGPFDFKTSNSDFHQHYISRVEIETNH